MTNAADPNERPGLDPTGSGPNDARGLVAGLGAQIGSVASDANSVKQMASDQSNKDRSWIARQIITVFVGTICAVLLLLLLDGTLTGQWGLVSGQAADLVKVTVLPVVTLVLGFYFGRSAGPG